MMRFEIERCRTLYASADAGIGLLPPASARCVQAARVLYSEILDRIEAADYDVFVRRARVRRTRKIQVAARAMLGRGRGDRC
jgi:phytoene synthase